MHLHKKHQGGQKKLFKLKDNSGTRKQSILMFAGCGEKEERNGWLQGKTEEIQAGQTRAARQGPSRSCLSQGRIPVGSMPLQSSGSMHFPPDKVKQRGKMRQSLAIGVIGGGEGRRRVMEALQQRHPMQDLSREHWGPAALLTDMSGRKTSAWAHKPSWCLLFSSPGLSIHTGRCWGEPQFPSCAWASKGYKSPKMSPASAVSPADPMCSAVHLARKQEADIAFSFLLPGASLCY